ncbi:MAG: 30S ribosomal protein S16 [Firmicutes bacterium]|nr:30S ribosomal protein S16 [candidate division NPL-UPA2 bacterium]MBT9153407.1 30S ribosomal protein S16 [candidate division NPL-UPA2 bacterium]MBT9155748.1 30S ribosomal protein S16 [candidate division NPL-UPA2 bacterium]
MATKIRLKRMGAKKAAFYRVVVADSRSPRDGRNIEELGFYNPVANPAVIKLDRERINYWLNQGVQMSDTVRGLLHRAGMFEKT